MRGFRVLVLIVIFSAAGVHDNAVAQNAPHASSTLVGVVLPSEATAGETISGTVVTDPDRYEHVPGLRVVLAEVPKPPQETADTASNTLHGVVVDVGDGRKRPADRPLVVKLLPQITTLTVSLLTRDGDRISRQDVPVAPQPAAPESETSGTNAPTLQQPPPPRPSERPEPTPQTPPAQSGDGTFTTPPVCTPHSVNVIHGPTTGDSTKMQVAVDDKPAAVVAARPGSVFWNVPAEVTPGPHTVKYSQSDDPEGRQSAREASMPVYALAVEMSADQLHMLRGQSTSMHVVVKGPEQMPPSMWRGAMPSRDLVSGDYVRRYGDDLARGTGTILLVIENRSPGVVRMAGGGNEIVLRLHQRDFAAGPYHYDGKLYSLQSGSFDISSTVTPFLADSAATPQMQPHFPAWPVYQNGHVVGHLYYEGKDLMFLSDPLPGRFESLRPSLAQIRPDGTVDTKEFGKVGTVPDPKAITPPPPPPKNTDKPMKLGDTSSEPGEDPGLPLPVSGQDYTRARNEAEQASRDAARPDLPDAEREKLRAVEREKRAKAEELRSKANPESIARLDEDEANRARTAAESYRKEREEFEKDNVEPWKREADWFHRQAEQAKNAAAKREAEANEARMRKTADRYQKRADELRAKEEEAETRAAAREREAAEMREKAAARHR